MVGNFYEEEAFMKLYLYWYFYEIDLFFFSIYLNINFQYVILEFSTDLYQFFVMTIQLIYANT